MSAVISQQTIAGLNCGAGVDSGDPLLMLHGVVRRWQTFLPLWPVLSQRWRLIVPDQRGHGQSPRALSYLVTDYIDDAVALLEAIGQPTVVYGHSLGAMAAFGAAARRPDLVRAVIAEDPPFSTMGEHIGETQYLDYFRSLQPLGGQSLPVEVIASRLGQLQIRHGSATRMLRDIRDEVSLRFTASALTRLDPAVLHPIVGGRWLDGYRWPNMLSAVKCPSLVFQADLDIGGMLRGHDVEFLQRHLREKLVLVPIKGCGHVMHWPHATSVAQHASIFLETL